MAFRLPKDKDWFTDYQWVSIPDLHDNQENLQAQTAKAIAAKEEEAAQLAA